MEAGAIVTALVKTYFALGQKAEQKTARANQILLSDTATISVNAYNAGIKFGDYLGIWMYAWLFHHDNQLIGKVPFQMLWDIINNAHEAFLFTGETAQFFEGVVPMTNIQFYESLEQYRDKPVDVVRSGYDQRIQQNVKSVQSPVTNNVPQGTIDTINKQVAQTGIISDITLSSIVSNKNTWYALAALAAMFVLHEFAIQNRKFKL